MRVILSFAEPEYLPNPKILFHMIKHNIFSRFLKKYISKIM